jgi:hypothetical protein
VPVAVTVGFEALPTVAIVVFRQLAPSITMTVYVPDTKPVAVAFVWEFGSSHK